MSHPEFYRLKGILADQDISYLLSREVIKIEPAPSIIQSVSVDLHVGYSLVVPKGGHLIDPLMGLGTTDRPRSMPIGGEGYALKPGQFILLATLEWVEVPAWITGIVCGKSSSARFGLQVEAAGLVDPGWKGVLTLELKNLGEDIIVLRPTMKIAQIYFLPGSSPSERPYGDPRLNSHYQGSGQVRVGVVDPFAPAQDAERPGD